MRRDPHRSPAQLQQQIVDFETNLYTAQVLDFFGRSAQRAFGATGGPNAIASQQFYIGINDPLGGNPTGAPFTSQIFSIVPKLEANTAGLGASARASVSRGETVFNTKPISITGVAGLNDTLNAPVIAGTCGTCHSSPNAGNHSVSLPINIGVADTTNSLGVSYLPVITLQNIATGQTVQTTDPGRALITGKWADIGKFKVPVLRGLSSRAPYFHNGSAASTGGRCGFLQYAVWDRVDGTGTHGSDCVSGDAIAAALCVSTCCGRRMLNWYFPAA